MTISNSITALAADATAWRQELHRHPELQYDVHWTAAFVAARLRECGCDEVVEGIGRTGVVGVIRGRRPGRAIGLRADMDALPIVEETGAPYASTTPGKMHACGHDGHTAMLLGAARHLAEARDFDGSVVVIFQPAEEGGAGGKAMVDDGLMERFAIEEVYGMHNMPGLPAGTFALRPGALMASTDTFDIVVTGRGAHAAKPHEGIDPVFVASQIVVGLQAIAARVIDPLKSAVVSVTRIEAGSTYNVIPQSCRLSGTCRSLEPAVRDEIETRLRAIATGIAAAHGARADIGYSRNYPVTVNHPVETDHAAAAARAVVGAGAVSVDTPPVMGGEDFAYMLEARPGAFIFVGNGDSAGLHHPKYDFNDAIIPTGIAYWTTLARMRLAA